MQYGRMFFLLTNEDAPGPTSRGRWFRRSSSSGGGPLHAQFALHFRHHTLPHRTHNDRAEKTEQNTTRTEQMNT